MCGLNRLWQNFFYNIRGLNLFSQRGEVTARCPHLKQMGQMVGTAFSLQPIWAILLYLASFHIINCEEGKTSTPKGRVNSYGYHQATYLNISALSEYWMCLSSTSRNFARLLTYPLLLSIKMNKLGHFSDSCSIIN